MAATSTDQDTSKGFTSCPRNAVYSPELNCIIGTVDDSAIEVLDIHTGSLLTRVSIQDEEDDSPLFGMYIDERDFLVVAKGQRIGCRGTLFEKIYLESILQEQRQQERSTLVKVELDVVQTGVLINGLVQCQDQLDCHGHNYTVKEKFNTVFTLFQKEYEGALRKVKHMDNKAIKWLTVCVEMECSLLYSVFHTLYSLLTSELRGPALPIVGDILHRALLLGKSLTDNFAARTERSYMLGEAERLETFNMWPHMKYKYALPGPMAEAGFYHPSSKVSGDRAMCFSCSVCLVCWEPSDQPWSEHERHSSSCPFVKGEYTENVPLNVCSGTAQAQEIDRPHDKIVCISVQDCSGLVAVGTELGYLIVWNTYPVLKKHYEVRVIDLNAQRKRSGTKRDSVLVRGIPKGALPKQVVTNINDDQGQPRTNEGEGPFWTLPSDFGYAFPEVAVPGDGFEGAGSETDSSAEDRSSSSSGVSGSDLAVDAAEEKGQTIHDVEAVNRGIPNSVNNENECLVTKTACNETHITAIVLARFAYKANEDPQLFSVVGLKRKESTNRTKLLLYVHNITTPRLRKNGDENDAQGVSKVKSSLIPVPGGTQDDPFFEIGEEFSGESDDSSVLSAIDEYLLATGKDPLDFHKPKVKDGQVDKSSKKCEMGMEDFVQYVELPEYLLHEKLIISQLLATERFIVVVINGTIGPAREEAVPSSKHVSIINASGSSEADNVVTAVEDEKRDGPDLSSSTDGFHSLPFCADQARDELSGSEGNIRNKSLAQSQIEPKSPSSDVAGGNSKKGTGVACHILCYSTSKNTKGNLISHTPVASRKFRGQELVQDCILVPYTKLSVGTVNEIHGSTSTSYSRENRFLFVGISGTENSILILEPFNLQTYYKISTGISAETSQLARIVFCAGLEVVACCYENGEIWSCSLKGKKEDLCFSIQQETEEEVSHLFIEADLDSEKIEQLSEVTSFDPMLAGVHISMPMDWVMGRTASLTKGVFNAKKFRPHVQELRPVTGPARIKTSSLSTSLAKSGMLKSTESSVIFTIFATAETGIGYLDLTVRCSCSITDLTDVAVTLKLMNDSHEDSDEEGLASKEDKNSLLCLPVLLSEHIGVKDTIANIILTSPKMMSIKSSHFLIELAQLTKVTESPLGRESEQGGDGMSSRERLNDDRVSRLCISDFITSIEVSVYQFAKTNLPWAPSCRRMMVHNVVFHERLIRFLTQTASSRICENGLSQRHMTLELLMWIGNILGNVDDCYSDQFRFSVGKFIPPLLETCFLGGDRSLAHSCYEFFIYLISRSSRNPDDTFVEDLAEAVKSLLRRVYESESVAAVRWFFRLASTLSSYTQSENLFNELFALLIHSAEIHRKGLSDLQMSLQSKFDVSGSPLDPILVEPSEVDLAIGETSATVIQCNSLNDNESVLKNSYGHKVFSIPSCDVPGLLEVQPLSFICCSTSDGACTEKFRTRKLKKPKALGVPQKLSDKYESPEDNVTAANSYTPFIPPWHDPDEKDEYYEVPEGPYDVQTMTTQNNTDVLSLDMEVNHLLQIGNTSTWGQSVKVGKGKKQFPRRKDDSFMSQAEDVNVRHQFSMPDPVALVIKRMHAVSHHFAILDFQQPIMLTDILIPPCSSLAALFIICWKGQETENDAIPLAASEDIGLKALVMSDIRPPVMCQYLKVTAVGTRTLNSAKVVIPLGQFYGYTSTMIQKNSVMSESINDHFDDSFCQYSLATDRLLSLLKESKHKSMNSDLTSEQVLKAYEDCSVAQFQLNAVVYHRMRIASYRKISSSEVDGLASPNDALQELTGESEPCTLVNEEEFVFDRPKLSRIQQDFLRVVIECCLETLLLLIIDADSLRGQLLDKESCCDLFKNICIYGSSKTRQQGCLLLQCLCGGTVWWGEFLAKSFRFCFGEEQNSQIPKERLFPCFVRLIQNSTHLASVYQSFLELLSWCVEPLILHRDPMGGKNTKSSPLLDWILLLLNEILPCNGRSSSDWTFLTPWDIIAQEKGSLEDRMYEGIKNYLHQRQQYKKKPSTNGSFLQQKKIVAAKKKYSSIHVVQDPQNLSNKLLKDLLQLRTHPALTRKGKATPVSSEGPRKSVRQRRVYPLLLSEDIVASVVERLLLLLSRSNITEHTECSILTCKVISSLCSSCQKPLGALESVISNELSTLLALTLDRNLSRWVTLGLTCLLKDFVALENTVQVDATTGHPEDVVTSLELGPRDAAQTDAVQKEGSSKDGNGVKGEEELSEDKREAELLDGLEGAASGIALSLASNLMKLIKERAPTATGKTENKDSKGARVTSNLLTASYLCNPILDDFFKVFAISCQRRVLRDNKDIYLVLREGLPSRQPGQEDADVLPLGNRNESLDFRTKSSEFFNTAFSNVLSLGGDSLDALELLIVLLDHGLSKRAVLSMENVSAFQVWLHELDFHRFCQDSLNKLVLSVALQLLNDFDKSKAIEGEKRGDFYDYSALYMKMSQVSTIERRRGLSLLEGHGAPGEHDILSLMLGNIRDNSDTLGEGKRLVLKRLLLHTLKVDSFPQDYSGLKTLLQLLMECRLSFHSCVQEELELDVAILLRLTDRVREFIEDCAEFLNMSWNYFSDKQVVFLLDKGRAFSAGKFGEDSRVKYCLLLVNFLEVLTSHDMETCSNRKEKGSAIRSADFSKLFSNITWCLNVFTRRHHIDVRDGVSDLLLQFPHSTKRFPLGIHPLGERLFDFLYSLRTCVDCKHGILEAFVECIRYQVQAKADPCSPIVVSDPLKHIALSLLDDRTVLSFIEMGGMSLIQDCIQNQRCNTVQHVPSSVIRNMLLRNQDRSLGFLSEKVDARKMLNGFEVENFAPCAKITGPPQCTPAEILLQSKARHQRLRFAAWSYQYQEQDNGWISLTIELPFVILLHEIVVKMHPSFLGGCPSETMLEIAGMGSKLLPCSPNLPTSGLSVIYLEFANGIFAKVVRVRFRRPVDSDSIRLNLIELFGVAALTEDDAGRSADYSGFELSPSVEILQHILMESPTSYENLKSSPEQTIELAKSLISMLNRMPSSLGEKVICNIVGKVLSTLGERVFEMVDYILSNGRTNGPISKQGSQIESRVLFEIYRYTTGDIRIRFLHHLLKWAQSLLQGTKVPLAGTSATRLASNLNILASLIFLALAEDPEIQLVYSADLFGLLVERARASFEDDELFQGLASLSCALISMSPWHFSVLSHHCQELAQSGLPPFHRSMASSVCFTVLSCLSSKSGDLLLSIPPVDNLITILKESLDEETGNDGSSIDKIVKILKTLDVCAKSPRFVRDYGFRSKRDLWTRLILFICELSTLHHTRSNPCLKDLHALQSCALGVLRKLLCSDEDERRHFVLLLLDVMAPKDPPSAHVLSCSFMKRMMIQLIIEEEEITVVIGKSPGRSPLDLHLQLLPDKVNEAINFLDHKFQMKMKLSDSLSLVTKTLLHTKNPEQPKREETTTTAKVADNTIGEIDGYVDMSSDGIALMFSSAKSAMDKRIVKGDEPHADEQDSTTITGIGLQFFCPAVSSCPLKAEMSIGQILQKISDSGQTFHRGQPLKIAYEPVQLAQAENARAEQSTADKEKAQQPKSLPTMLHTFATEGGLAVLAQQMSHCMDLRGEEVSSDSISIILRLLPLNGFANILLKERRKAEYLLRLMLGVEENSEGDPIATSSFASELHLLPFVSLKHLLDSTPLFSENGSKVRNDAFQQGVVSMVLEQLALRSNYERSINGKEKTLKKQQPTTDGTPSYWAKGTGFGTGSTASTWDVEKAIQEKKKEEDHVICLLQVLTSYLGAGEDPLFSAWKEENDQALPAGLPSLLQSSNLMPLLSGYLRNDSVLDMANHIPLYHTVMEILRCLASFKFLHRILLRRGGSEDSSRTETAYQLLMKLNSCADTYMERLRAMKTSKKTEGKAKKSSSRQPKEPKRKEASRPLEPENEELSILIKDIMDTALLVRRKGDEFKALDAASSRSETDASDANEGEKMEPAELMSKEDEYVLEMKRLQFDTYEIVGSGEDDKVVFNVPYHFASSVRAAITSGSGSAMRSRRLAQEVASLSTSLPISHGSSVIMRCDESRLDVMKVLITGPEDTPYANGCFEFDIFFPTDYPASPVMVNLQTTGQHSVRLNPNLYNDGKVCLSILNTWHGRPEEKWNPTTSNLLQVLVSIQSLILVPEPYFNEPGYERMRSTPFGQQNSFSYNANIRQAVVRWGMIEQLRKPSPCFTEVIQKHFMLKKDLILQQCENWLAEMKEQCSVKKSNSVHYEALKNHYWTLKSELEKLEQGKLQVHLPSTSKENSLDAQSGSAGTDYVPDVYTDLGLGGPVAYV